MVLKNYCASKIYAKKNIFNKRYSNFHETNWIDELTKKIEHNYSKSNNF